jgi:hypothetical protein
MIFSIIISLVFSFLIYLLLLQTPLVSKRELSASLLIFIALIWPIYFLTNRFLFIKLKSFPLRMRVVLLLGSALVGCFVLLSTNHPPLYVITPEHAFQISIPASTEDANQDRIVTISWITHELGDVSFSQLKTTGEWIISEDGISHKGPQEATLEWKGKAGKKISIEFENTPYSNPLEIYWNGQQTSVDLLGSTGKTKIVTQTYDAREGYHPLIVLMIWFTTSFLFLLLTVVFITSNLQSKTSTRKKTYSWIIYALPMMIVWGIYLLAFFPGMMSPDSNDQWRQIITGRFNDTHPVFHTLSMWLVTRIWLSPAVVVISQILFLSLTVSWGIRLLDDHGLPSWASWSLVVIFAIAPLNGNMVVTLWKDIPYSTSLLLLSLMILKIVFTNGVWLERRMSWVWLGLISLCVASFRHNGIAVALITFPILINSFRNLWKPLLFAAGLSAIIYVIIQGPFYTYLNVDRASGIKQQTLVQHIAAHIVTGEKLSPLEIQLANSILPINEWKYNCCYHYDLFKSPSFSQNRLTDNIQNIQNLFIRLSIKEPLVELKHLSCISSLVWEMPSRCGSTTLLPYTSSLWFDPGGGFFQEKSLLPAMKYLLSSLLISIRTNPNLTIFIAPAVYLFLALYNTALLAYRRRSSRVLLFIIPALIQSLTLAVVNVSSEFRYQFGIYLIGLYSLGLLILALYSPSMIKEENK